MREPNAGHIYRSRSINSAEIANANKSLIRCHRHPLRTAGLPTDNGMFPAIAYHSEREGIEHLALVMCSPATAPAPLVRLHSERIIGDLAGSLGCAS
jgi:hypothetical protein